jgi:hypothetical protein
MTLMPTRSRGVLAIIFHPDFAFTATEGDYILVDFMTADDNNFGFASNTLDLKHFNTLNANFQLLTVCSISDNLSCNAIAESSDTSVSQVMLWLCVHEHKPRGSHFS